MYKNIIACIKQLQKSLSVWMGHECVDIIAHIFCFPQSAVRNSIVLQTESSRNLKLFFRTGINFIKLKREF